MTNLIPESVKAALKEHCGRWDKNGQWLYGETTSLEEMVEAITRDWLRLKEVEKVAHRMQKAWYDNPTGSSHCSATREMEAAIATFRAAVEGK